jgi:hypothetical protein
MLLRTENLTKADDGSFRTKCERDEEVTAPRHVCELPIRVRCVPWRAARNGARDFSLVGL